MTELGVGCFYLQNTYLNGAIFHTENVARREASRKGRRRVKNMRDTVVVCVYVWRGGGCWVKKINKREREKEGRTM